MNQSVASLKHNLPDFVFGKWSVILKLDQQSSSLGRKSEAQPYRIMALTPRIPSIGAETVSFLNRDHIISVTIHEGEIVVLTTAGTEITIPASAETIARSSQTT